jgi:hypothetical protein
VLGEAVEFLMASGHPALDYTPRQIVAFMYFAQRRKQRELGELMWASAMGARAKEKDVNKELKTLMASDG